jgi:hypothetical protein
LTGETSGIIPKWGFRSIDQSAHGCVTVAEEEFMGGISGTVSGKTKIACYLKFAQHRDQILEKYFLERNMVTPGNKRDAYKAMSWDQEKQQWVLRFRIDE